MRAHAQLLVLATTVAAATAATKINWDGLHVTWAPGGEQAYKDGKGFFKLPVTSDAAKSEGWVQARQEALVSLWCMPNDPRVCELYDRNDTIAGLQISFLLDDLKGTPYKWRDHSLFLEDNIFGQDVAGGRLYLVPQDVLEAGGRTSLDEVGTGVWLQDGDNLVNVPLDADKLEPLGWTKQNCIPTMGLHYYYNMTKTMECEDFEPFFVLVDVTNNQVHGMGYQTFGNKSKTERDWDENLNLTTIESTVPNAPECLFDWSEEYGDIILHMYFIDDPYLGDDC